MNRAPKIILAVAFIVLCSTVAQAQWWRPRVFHNFHSPAAPTSFSPSGKTLLVVTGNAYDKVQLWDVRKKSLRLSIAPQYDEAFPESIRSWYVLSSDGAVTTITAVPVASGSTRVKTWDAKNGKLLHKLDLYGQNLFYSRDRRFLSEVNIHDSKAQVTTWRTRTGQRVCDLKIRAPKGLSFHSFSNPASISTPASMPTSRSSDGQWVAMSLWQVKRLKNGSVRDEYRGIVLYDGRTGKRKRFLRRSSAFGSHAIVFSPDSRTVAVAGENRIALWDTKTGKLRVMIETGPDLFGLDFSPDSTKIAGSDWESYAVRIWSTRTGRLLRNLKGHEEGVTEFTFSPDSRTLASGDEQGKVRLWRIG